MRIAPLVSLACGFLACDGSEGVSPDNRPGPPTTLSQYLGATQNAVAGTLVIEPPVLKVSDARGKGVPGVAVTFSACRGGGFITGDSTVTDSNGLATVGSWTVAWGDNLLCAYAKGVEGGMSFRAEGGPDLNCPCWSPRAPMPHARSDFGVGVVGGILYVMGGRLANVYPLTRDTTVEAYDPATGSWTRKAPMPGAFTASRVAVVNGILYTIGGMLFQNELGAVGAYNPVTDTWSVRASLPSRRSGFGLGVVDGIIFVVGGYGGAGVVATVESYDPSTDTWTSRAPMPGPRSLVSVGAIDGILYAAGEGAGLDAGPTFEAYDPTTNRWTTKARRLEGHTGPSLGVLNGMLYAIGGTSQQKYPSGSVGWVESYDPSTDKWTTRGSMTDRSDAGVVAINGILYAVGGVRGFLVYATLVEAIRPS